MDTADDETAVVDDDIAVVVAVAVAVAAVDSEKPG